MSTIRGFGRRAALAGASLLVLSAASPALAQAPAKTAAPAQVAEVIVTAQKREERLLDVGLAVSSLNAETLRTQRVANSGDLVGLAPNLDVKENIPGAQAIVTVRGVGLNDFSSTNNSTVGVYVDDVFLASFAEMDFNLYDLERIEVLKGPQGTLYGRNSTAGAINIISAGPSLAGDSGVVSATAGNFGRYEGEAAVNLVASDQLAFRFSGKAIKQDDGYWTSRTLRSGLGQQDILLGRAQMLWRPTEATTVKLKLEAERNRSSIGSGKFFGTIPAVVGATCPNFANPAVCTDSHGFTDTNPDPFSVTTGHAAPYRVSQTNATLHVDQDLGSVRLSSVTGYIDFKRGFYIDADAAPTTDAEFDQNDKVRQFTQELRLAGGMAGRATWLIGAYYSWDRVQTFSPGFLHDLFNTNALITADQKTESRAVFGQVDWTLTPRLKLVTGLRYTDEDRSYVGGTTDLNSFGLSFLCFAVGACALGAPGTHVLSLEDASIHDRNWSWRGGLNFKPNDDSLVYGTIARGTKSGGFFNGITTNSFALAPYRPEQLTDYEAGVKTRLLDRTLQFEASVFWYDYKDLQTQTFTNVGAVSLIKLGNVGKATVKGLDAQVTWLPVRGLTLNAGLGLLDTELGSFSTAGAAGVIIVPKGNKLPNAPDASFNGQARYEWPVTGDWTAAVQAAAHYSSKVFKESLNTPSLSAGSYWLLDARASLASRAGWEFAVWGKNLGDERYVTQATDDGLGMGYRVFNAPRTYGVSVTKRFD
ncbi:TonB-dependent receptor [Phenylobacterium sp.]|uniref:TonB-dependent receptor n=1 Tax=Phenylobacterium sp. TaxID=1871053 RepID=UPI00356A6C85